MEEKDKKNFAMTREGIKLMLTGLVVMVAGFILLCSGGVTDPETFNYDMFDARRLVLAPITITAGIVLVIVSIMHRWKDSE